MIARRRDLLRAGGLLAVAMAAAWTRPAFAQPTAMEVRRLSFNNLHTGEKVSVDYFVEGTYVPEALACIDKVLRDFRTGEIHPIAPRLLDLLAVLRGRLESQAPFEVISGYRSPKTNALLHQASSGVAAKSLHMEGKAIDVRLSGCPLANLRKAALALRGGGVGYYPKDGFVHVDIGRVRSW